MSDFVVGEKERKTFVRGGNPENFVKDQRDQLRRQVDFERTTPRILNLGNPLPTKLKTSKITGLNNKGYDKRDLIKCAREKFQHNKSKTEFMNSSFSQGKGFIEGSGYLEKTLY